MTTKNSLSASGTQRENEVEAQNIPRNLLSSRIMGAGMFESFDLLHLTLSFSDGGCQKLRKIT